jgi:hypothetical protein
MTDGDPANRSPGIRGRVLLVSAPWPLFNRPSLPLGALKAYLSETLPGLNVQASHLFLKVANELGYDRNIKAFPGGSGELKPSLPP